ELEVDQRRRTGVGGLLRRARRRIVDGQPLAVCSGKTGASTGVDVLVHAGAAVVGGCDAEARQGVEVGEVLAPVAGEVEVGVSAAGRIDGPGKRAGWRARRDR